MSSDEKEKKKVNAIMVIEILGRPPEYLIETLENLIKTMSEEQGVTLKEKKIREPIPLKENPSLYSSFAELNVDVEEMLYLALLVFKYMPAHVEVISPQNFNFSNLNFNDMLNELARRLHGYEEVARVLQTEKMILENQLKTILGEKKVETKPETAKGKKEKTKKEVKEKKLRKPRTKKIKKADEEKIEELKEEIKEKEEGLEKVEEKIEEIKEEEEKIIEGEE
jgi:hypothetical protein